MKTNVTLMTPDPSVATAVTAALQSNGHVVTGPPIADLRELAAQLAKSQPPIVLIDLDPHPQQVLPHLERIVSRYPATRFVALSTTLGSDLLQEAMQTGVRRVVVKQTMGAELKGVLDRLTPSGAAEPAGQMIGGTRSSESRGSTGLAPRRVS